MREGARERDGQRERGRERERGRKGGRKERERERGDGAPVSERNNYGTPMSKLQATGTGDKPINTL